MADELRKPMASRTSRRRYDWLVVGSVLAVVVAGLAYAGWDLLRAPVEKPLAPAKLHAVKARPMAPVATNTFEDDGETLWVSPTDSPPLGLAYLPPGVEIVLAVRPAELLAHVEGEKIVAGLGPLGAEVIEIVERAAGLPLRDIEQLIVGWQIARDGSCVATMVIEANSAISRGDAEAETSYQPESAAGRILVFSSASVIAEIRELNGSEPPIARDLERLVARTDLSRQVTVLFRPATILSDGSRVLGGAMWQLRRPLEWFVGRDIGAMSLSVNWGEDFFIELLAIPTLDSSPEKMADALAKRMAELPERVEDHVLDLNASPYGRRIVARLPEMVRKLSAYTRHGFDRDCAVLRCYLPAIAGHNLLMAAELVVAEGAVDDSQELPLAEARSPSSIGERLGKRTSLKFERETLESALRMLSDDIGVEIVIRGEDLQLEGITRNQLLAIDAMDEPAAWILAKILQLANPDKLATGPADPRQKLVYILGPETIIITTRAKAEQRGEPLPQHFRPPP